MQGHRVHVVGVGEYWGRDLPGLVGAAVEKEERKKESGAEKEKMKIAWRYERLGEFGESSRGGIVPCFIMYILELDIFHTSFDCE